MLQCGGVQPIVLPPRSPNLNAFAERWVRSIKQECVSRLILFGEAALRRTVTEFLSHYHLERPHQGKGNQLLFPSPLRHHQAMRVAFNVTSASVDCSSFINARHECFPAW